MLQNSGEVIAKCHGTVGQWRTKPNVIYPVSRTDLPLLPSRRQYWLAIV